MLVKPSSRPANRPATEIVRLYGVSSDEADGGKIPFWSLVVGYIIESFALYAASVHPVGLFPTEPSPARQKVPQPRQVSRLQRRAILTLVSTTVGQGASSPEPGSGAAPAPQAGSKVVFADGSPREREIEKAIAALAALDDRTLQDLGIPHRSHIERTVRYCHDC